MAKERDVIVRTESFPIVVNAAQEQVLWTISDNLWQTWEDGLKARQKHTEVHHEPFFVLIKEARERKDHDRVQELRVALKKAFKDFPQPTGYDQINLLTNRRAKSSVYARVNRNWQEETLKLLYGAYKSFMILRKNGDLDARPPQEKDPKRFCGILGRTGFKVSGNRFEMLCEKIAPETKLAFTIPEHQLTRLSRGRVKSFTVDHEGGRFKVGINYEFPKPEAKPFVPKEAVYIALGSWSLGIVSPRGEEEILLGRPDVHWKPKADAVTESLKREAVGSNLHALTSGSRKFRKLQKKRGRMFEIMRQQQKQGRRETVAHELIDRREIKRIDQVLFHGIHFVVSDLIVRSKKGKLADATKSERGGPLGANWSAQNTGAIAYLVQWLEEKVAEYGGSVRKHKLPSHLVPSNEETEKKIAMARALRDDFLKSYSESRAA